MDRDLRRGQPLLLSRRDVHAVASLHSEGLAARMRLSGFVGHHVRCTAVTLRPVQIGSTLQPNSPRSLTSIMAGSTAPGQPKGQASGLIGTGLTVSAARAGKRARNIIPTMLNRPHSVIGNEEKAEIQHLCVVKGRQPLCTSNRANTDSGGSS